MNLRYFIAARYILSPKSHSVINLISGVSIVAMAVPVAAIILLLSIFNGLEQMVGDMYRDVDADLSITPAEGTTFEVAAVDAAALRQTDGVEALSFVLRQTAMAESGDGRTFAEVVGVDDEYRDVVAVANYILSGDYALQSDSGPSAVAAHGVMRDLGMLRQTAIGESVRLYSINRARFSSLLPVGGYTRRELSIAGIYGPPEDHGSMLLIPLASAQSLFAYPDRASSVEVRLSPSADMDAVAERIATLVGEDFEVRTRFQSNSLYRLMALEKWGVFLIAALVMLVASLSVVGTLVMIIIDKQHDIHTLRTMGAGEKLVRGIFLGEGRLMALLSLVIGVVMGLLLTLLQQQFGMVRIDAPSLAVSSFPVEVQLQDVVLTVVSYLAISYLVINLTVRSVMSYKPNR